MSKRGNKIKQDADKAEKIKKLLPVEEANTEIINKLVDKIGELVSDSTDGIGGKIREIFDPILEEFKELVKENEDEKNSVTGLIKTFTILLTEKCSSYTKLKRIIKTSAEIAINLWPEQKQQ